MFWKKKAAASENTDVPPRPPSMSRSEFRTLYTGLGGVMFVAGLGLYANYVNTVVLAAKGAGIAGSQLALLIFGLVLAFGGVYVLVAALSENPRLWLPRKRGILQHEARQESREAVRAIAEAALSQAIIVTTLLKRDPQLTTGKVAWWQDHIWGTVNNAWGTKESAMLTHPIPTDRLPDDAANARAYIELIEPLLLNISQRSHTLPMNPLASPEVARERFGGLLVQWQQLSQQANQQQTLPFAEGQPEAETAQLEGETHEEGPEE